MGLALALLHPAAHHPGRPLQDEIPDAGSARQQGVYLAKERQGGHRSPFLRFSSSACWPKRSSSCRGRTAAGLVLRPVANLGKPALVVLAGVTADLPLGLAADLVRLRQPPGFHRPDAGHGDAVPRRRVSSPATGRISSSSLSSQLPHLPQQGGGARPEPSHPRAGG